MSREELIELAKAGEFDDPVKGDEPEQWWERWLSLIEPTNKAASVVQTEAAAR